MQRLFEMVRKLSTVKSNVLIVGESGTGKELFARAIHYNGITRDKPFVAVNCGAIPDSLIESELFGYRRGAFTGAIRDKIGYFEAANGGTLFLDEISTLPIGVQSSLLRVLEERVVDARRRHPAAAGRRAHHRRLQPGPRQDGRRRASSARTCCTASTSSSSPCRRCASARKTSRCWSITSWTSTPRD